MELFEFVLALSVLFFALIILALFLLKSVRVYNEYERGVRFRLGRFDKVIGPGICFAFPYIDATVVVDTRLRTLELQGLKAMTKEKATAFIDVVVRYRVSSPELAVMKVADLHVSLKALVEAVVRSTIGELTFSELIEKREFINARLRESVSTRAEEWGLKIDGIELTDVTPSERALKLIKGTGTKIRRR
jgi:regulator of protease activity HflC (stomatin/prohibitin superfamily)